MPTVLLTQRGISQPRLRSVDSKAFFGKKLAKIIGHGQFAGGKQYYRIKLVECGTELASIAEDLLT